MDRTPHTLSLLPPSSPRLRQRSREVPVDVQTTLEVALGPREEWPIMLRTAYVGTYAYVTLEHVLADLRATFDKHPAYGLAAPQVGIQLRIILVRGNANDQPTTIINPKITSRSGERRGPEHCLSVPGVKKMVRRAANVVVDGVGVDGAPLSIRAHGLFAAVIQHEVDHLDGILMTSR